MSRTDPTKPFDVSSMPIFCENVPFSPWIRLFRYFQDHQFIKWVGDDGPARAMWLMTNMGQDIGPATPFSVLEQTSFYEICVQRTDFYAFLSMSRREPSWGAGRAIYSAKSSDSISFDHSMEGKAISAFRG
jgi:hypothetical protein